MAGVPLCGPEEETGSGDRKEMKQGRTREGGRRVTNTHVL